MSVDGIFRLYLLCGEPSSQSVNICNLCRPAFRDYETSLTVHELEDVSVLKKYMDYSQGPQKNTENILSKIIS
jgi:hypothetical protein